MALPIQPVTLTAEQVAELQRNLSTLRHDVNNRLAMLMAAGELGRLQQAMSDRMSALLAEQPRLIVEDMNKFSAALEQTLGIRR